MGQLLDLGPQAGKAARGEYGNDALLTQSGLVVIRDPTTLVPAAKFPPGYLLAGNAAIGAGLSNPGTTETSLLSAAITGGFPTGVAVGDRVVISAAGKYVGNAGSAQTLTINVKSGSTQLATFTGGSHAASASQRWFQFDAEVEYNVIGGSGSMTTKGRLLVGGTGTGSQAFGDLIGNDAAAVTVANNAAAALDLTGVFSVGTATSTASLNMLAVTYHPKNY